MSSDIENFKMRAVFNTISENNNKFKKCRFFLALSDFLFLSLALFFSLFFLSLFDGGIERFVPHNKLKSILLIYFLLFCLCVFWFLTRLRHYTYRKPFWSELKEILRTIIIFSFFDLALVALSKSSMSRYAWLFIWMLALIFVPVGRVLTRKLLVRYKLWARDTIIIGSGNNAKDAYDALTSEKYLGFNILSFISSTNEISPPVTLLNTPVYSFECFDFSTINRNDIQFVIALEYDQHDLRDFWLRKLSRLGFRNVSVIPSLRGVPLYGTDMSFFFSHEVMLLRVNNNLAKKTSIITKRTFDLISSIVLLIILSPLFIFLAYKVSRDGGVVFYGHERIGQNGKKFQCYKFRSMIVNSQEVLQSLLDSDPKVKEEWEKDFKLKNDPRITSIGHFIRRTSLDELPQLWNVLKGDMSLVGPRPIVEEELERYNDDVDYYLMVKPGMTGLWQVSGRNDVEYDTRVYLDAWYVKNWALWNDIAILFKTINVVLKRDGAY